MTSGCGDTLSLADLQTAKKHQLFEAEVITGKQGGIAGGADIDTATNQVTGQLQKTLPAVLRDAGFTPASFDFSTGGTLSATDRNKAVYDPASKTWYLWKGTLPHVVAAGTNPVGNADWTPYTDPIIRNDLNAKDGLKLIGACVDMPALRTVAGASSGQQIFLRSYVAGENLGGGIFQWDSSSTKPDDGGCVIQATDIVTGRWVRQNVVDKTPEMFGAIGDGITDDTAALQRMFTSANLSPVLAENFFGTFKLRHKYIVSATLNCGRPIKVDAIGAEFIVTANTTCVKFSMHNGTWTGGYFNYTTLSNSQVTELSVAMELAPETSPVMVMASTISQVRIWGAHTGVKFSNPNTEIWALHLSQIQPWVRAGASTKKAVGFSLDSQNGAGGSTTIRLTECMVAGYGATTGVGLKGFYFNGQNEVMMDNCAYDWYDVAAGVNRTVGARDVIDATVFNLTVRGFHTEQLVNTTATFTESPIYINTNSCALDGFEMLLTDHTNTAAWVWLAGNGCANIGRWHELPKTGVTRSYILNIATADRTLQIFSTGSVRSTDILGGSSQMNLTIAGEAAPYHTDFDIQIQSGQAFFNLPSDCSSLSLSVVGANISDGNAGFAASLILVKDSSNNWNIDSRIVKMPAFAGATISFSVVGQQVAFTANNAFTYRIQTRIEWKRALLANW